MSGQSRSPKRSGERTNANSSITISTMIATAPKPRPGRALDEQCDRADQQRHIGRGRDESHEQRSSELATGWLGAA